MGTGAERSSSMILGSDLILKDSLKHTDPAYYHEIYSHLYFMVCGNYVKIGRTDGPVEDRRRALQCGSPSPIKTVLVFMVLRPLVGKIEKHLHNALAHHRASGEWFKMQHNPDSYEWEDVGSLQDALNIITSNQRQ